MARILVYEKQEIPKELAKLVIEHQNKAIASPKGFFDIAISGGSLATTLCEGLVGNSEVKWSKWRVWLADERVVPLTSPDSNMGVFISDCVNKIPESHSKPLLEPISEGYLKSSESVSSQQYASEYEDRIKKTLGPKPEFDLVCLGMGPDGHTCSLFPGHELLNVTDRYVAGIDDSPKPPPQRITLTKPILALAKQIVFVATGASKYEAIHGVFTKNDKSLPAKQVNDLAKTDVLWFADKAALGTDLK